MKKVVIPLITQGLRKLYKKLNPLHMIAGHFTPITIDFTDEYGMPLNLTGSTCKYVLANFSTRNSVVNKNAAIYYDSLSSLASKFPSVTYPFTVHVELNTLDTVNLEGDFIQQFILCDYRNEEQLPCEGDVVIQRNSDLSTTDQTWFLNVDEGGLFASPNNLILIKGSRTKIDLYYLDNRSQKVSIPPYGNIIFTSDNVAIASVMSGQLNAGYVTAVSEGECCITAMVSAKPEIYADIYVKVIDISFKWYNDVVSGSFVNFPSFISLVNGSSTWLDFRYTSIASGTIFTPPNNDIEYSGYNDSIIEVTAYGQIMTVGVGTTTITAKAFNNGAVTTTIPVTVVA